MPEEKKKKKGIQFYAEKKSFSQVKKDGFNQKDYY